MKKYTVGDVSKITGVSKDMLRFYDKIGLLKPAYVNPLNNYRYYTHDQFWLIDIIQMCRGLDIPLKIVGMILESRNDDKVMDFLIEHQKEAIARSQYFQRVAEDISWYVEQHERAQTTFDTRRVTVRHMEERQVLLGRSDEETYLYHLKLQELCHSTLKSTDAFRRHYGFMLDVERMKQNAFIKQAEYLSFEGDILKEASSEELTTIPEGDYACCMVNVMNDEADFIPLLSWCEREGVTVDYVIADEIGLHLFYYFDQNYVCEAKVLLK